MSLRFDWHKGTLKQDLAMLPEDMLQAAFEALDDAATFMVTMAKAYVLVDTGTLQKTIRKERGGETEHRRVVRVRAGGYFVNPKTGKICDYAVHVERKQPYMRPAWETVKSFVEGQIKLGVLEKVSR